MGIRSQRYAMVVDDGVVKTLNVEAPGKFEVSDARDPRDVELHVGVVAFAKHGRVVPGNGQDASRQAVTRADDRKCLRSGHRPVTLS